MKLQCVDCKCGWEEGTYNVDCNCHCHYDPHGVHTEQVPSSMQEGFMRIMYVRFGDLPKDGKSRNAVTGVVEAGVSVYEALERDGKYQILLPKMDPQAVATLGMCFNTAQGLWGQVHHPLYVVEGILVGTGSDGEPLLSDCRVVKRVFPL